MSGTRPAHHGGHEVERGFAPAMEAAMTRIMAAMRASKPRGNAHREFLAMVIPDHEGAVEMLWLVL